MYYGYTYQAPCIFHYVDAVTFILYISASQSTLIEALSRIHIYTPVVHDTGTETPMLTLILIPTGNSSRIHATQTALDTTSEISTLTDTDSVTGKLGSSVQLAGSARWVVDAVVWTRVMWTQVQLLSVSLLLGKWMNWWSRMND